MRLWRRLLCGVYPWARQGRDPRARHDSSPRTRRNAHTDQGEQPLDFEPVVTVARHIRRTNCANGIMGTTGADFPVERIATDDAAAEPLALVRGAFRRTLFEIEIAPAPAGPFYWRGVL